DVRKAAAKALGQTGDVRAVEPLIVALGDMYEDVCKAAVEVLGQIGDARAVKSLIAALEDGWTIRYNAAKQRDKTDDTYADESTAQRQKSLEVALLYSHRIRYVAAEALIMIGDAAVKPLIAVLQNWESDVRKAAVYALGRISDTRAVEPLIAKLKDKRENVCKAAVEALGEIGDARAVEPLIAVQKHWYRDVRKAAKKALKKISLNAEQAADYNKEGLAQANHYIIRLLSMPVWLKEDNDINRLIDKALQANGYKRGNATIDFQFVSSADEAYMTALLLRYEEKIGVNIDNDKTLVHGIMIMGETVGKLTAVFYKK
ncbi:MAG: HEAT repeat domain-containing protein, partial [Eubacteriales bacterium]|nr:HEAT repeat domain-containing protein [Eubacteriales bacterium]